MWTRKTPDRSLSFTIIKYLTQLEKKWCMYPPFLAKLSTGTISKPDFGVETEGLQVMAIACLKLSHRAVLAFFGDV